MQRLWPLALIVVALVVVLHPLACKDAAQPPIASVPCLDRVIAGYGSDSACPRADQHLEVIVRHGLGADAVYICRCGVEAHDGGTK